MKYDGKLLARARDAIDAERARNTAEQDRRRELVYLRIPEIENIDQEMRRQMSELIRLTLSRSSLLSDRIEELKVRNLKLQTHRSNLLIQNGFSPEYLDPIYSCSLCKDTGYLDGQICDCLKKRYNLELTRELSGMLHVGNASFENFDLSLYSNAPDPITGRSSRQSMEAVYAGCLRFAQNFPDVSANLLLRGPTGVGKTYLSACIARLVSENGYSVCYDSASSALGAFEQQKFSRDPGESASASMRVQRMLSCDLMILDDLGTEMNTPMSVSALYTLLNTRLNNGKRLIISTNCPNEELENRYTSQICSRIYGEFLELPFSGEDIRLLKRNQ